MSRRRRRCRVGVLPVGMTGERLRSVVGCPSRGGVPACGLPWGPRRTGSGSSVLCTWEDGLTRFGGEGPSKTEVGQGPRPGAHRVGPNVSVTWVPLTRPTLCLRGTSFSPQGSRSPSFLFVVPVSLLFLLPDLGEILRSRSTECDEIFQNLSPSPGMHCLFLSRTPLLSDVPHRL